MHMARHLLAIRHIFESPRVERALLRPKLTNSWHFECFASANASRITWRQLGRRMGFEKQVQLILSN